MKKLSKLMALLLSLLMIVSLFAACGDDKKKDDDDDEKEETTIAAEKDDDDDKKDKDEADDEDEEEKLTGEKLLIGEWEAIYEVDGVSITLVFDFAKDGSVESTYSKAAHKAFLEQLVEASMAEVTEEDLEADGFETMEEAEEYLAEYFEEEFPYEDMAAEFENNGEWELDGDELTFQFEDGEPQTADTKLSKGKTTFTLVNEEDGTEFKFTKID